MMVAKEIEMKGTFRFHEEFELAVDFIGKRKVDLNPLLTGTFPWKVRFRHSRPRVTEAGP